MTTATTTALATAASARRPREGMFSSLATTVKALAAVTTNVAMAGSESAAGLSLSASAFKVAAFDDLVDKYGSIEALETLEAATNAYLQRMRNNL